MLTCGGHETFSKWRLPLTESVKSSPKHFERMAAGIGAIFPIIIVVIFGTLLFLPLSPSITGTFTIQTTQGYPNKVDIRIVTASYSKQTLIRSYAARDGSLTLPVRPSETGAYTMTITVTYGDTTNMQKEFPSVGDGTYSFEFLYTWRQETSSVPYVVTISVSGTGIATVVNSFQVFP